MITYTEFVKLAACGKRSACRKKAAMLALARLGCKYGACGKKAVKKTSC